MSLTQTQILYDPFRCCHGLHIHDREIDHYYMTGYTLDNTIVAWPQQKTFTLTVHLFSQSARLSVLSEMCLNTFRCGIVYFAFRIINYTYRTK